MLLLLQAVVERTQKEALKLEMKQVANGGRDPNRGGVVRQGWV